MDEHPRIADRDWRLHAITTTTSTWTSPSTGIVHPPGTAVELLGFLQFEGETFAVPLADAAAMWLSLAMRASRIGRTAKENLLAAPPPGSIPRNFVPIRRLPASRETSFIDAVQETASSIVFSYTAIEAFTNALIPAAYVYRRVRSDGRCTEEFDRAQLERHVHLNEKLNVVVPSITKLPSVKGTAIWEHLVRLERLRSRLVHLKREDWREQKPEAAASTLWADLLQPDVPMLYKTAVEIFAHFTSTDRPRWVKRAMSMAAADAA